MFCPSLSFSRVPVTHETPCQSRQIYPDKGSLIQSHRLDFFNRNNYHNTHTCGIIMNNECVLVCVCVRMYLSQAFTIFADWCGRERVEFAINLACKGMERVREGPKLRRGVEFLQSFEGRGKTYESRVKFNCFRTPFISPWEKELISFLPKILFLHRPQPRSIHAASAFQTQTGFSHSIIGRSAFQTVLLTEAIKPHAVAL